MQEASDHTRRVVIVEDEPFTRRVLSRMLQQSGWAVEEVGGGLAALAIIDAWPPSVVLTDLRMPGMDGVQLVEILKERAPGVPVVVMTGSGEIATAVRAMRAGAADYLTKPIEIDALMLALERAIDVAQLGTEAHGLRWQREITAALAKAPLDVRAVQETLVRHTAEWIGDLCCLRLLSDDGATLLPSAHHHRQTGALAVLEEPLRRPLDAREGTVAKALASPQAVLFHPIPVALHRELVAYLSRAYDAAFGISSLILAPLHSHGAAMGLLTCVRGPLAPAYGQRDLMLAQDLADRAALAIENARLYGRLEGQMRQIAQTEESLRKTEERLSQAQRTEALGRLAGGVAHDFNNVLSVVIGSADLLLEEEPLSNSGRGHVDGILKVARHGAALTGQLLAFGRQQLLEPRVVDPNEILLEVEDVLRRVAGPQHELVLDLAAGMGSVKVDPTKIQQVMMNLVSNARDAMPGGGRVTIRTDREDPPEAQAEDDASAPARHYAMMAVVDTGVGMSAVTIARIFEPFFTTKAVGKGTGLGLATVHGIVQQSGGHVLVESRPGHGATFKVFFPLSEGVLQQKTSRPRMRAVRGPESILLVDDDVDVRVLTRRLLQRAGYRVLDAAGPAEARGLCNEEPGTIELLLTDLLMPGISGLDLARELSRTRPQMRVIYMSGYAQNAMGDLGDLPEGAAFLQKPIGREALLAKVRGVLDGSDGPG